MWLQAISTKTNDNDYVTMANICLMRELFNQLKLSRSVLKDFSCLFSYSKMSTYPITSDRPQPKNDNVDELKYQEAIKKLNSLQTNASVLQEARKKILSGNLRSSNVDSTKKYLDRIGLNIDDFDNRIIHISGTKGKGSTAMVTESLLRSVPYRTGLFVSPHLVSVRERISINGTPLSLSTFVDYFWQVYNPLFQLKDDDNDMPSYFKFLTVMALKVFISENVDVAIVEVGIGGEYDCTNVFKKTPVVGITSIGLDHTKILGETVEKIAWQKGGIFKEGCRAFTVPDHKESVLKVLQERAREKQCQLEIVPQLTEYSWNTSDLTFPQRLNASLALQLAKSWDFWNNNRKHVNYDKLQVSEREKCAISQCQIPGRCHIRKEGNTTFYLDGAHTVESMNVAKDWFDNLSPKNSSRILIFNVTGGRSVQPLLEVLKHCTFSEVIFCSNSISDKPENLPPDLIDAGVGIEEGLTKAQEHLKVWSSLDKRKGSAVATVSEALALASSLNDSHVLITGSLHLVGSALTLFQPL